MQHYLCHPIATHSEMVGTITKFLLIRILRKFYLSQLEVKYNSENNWRFLWQIRNLVGLKATLQKSILIVQFLTYKKYQTALLCINPRQPQVTPQICVLKLGPYSGLFFLEFAFSVEKNK